MGAQAIEDHPATFYRHGALPTITQRHSAHSLYGRDASGPRQISKVRLAIAPIFRAFAPSWHFNAAGQVFKGRIGDLNGNWWDLRAGVNWMYNRHLGLSVGYEKFILRVDVSKANFSGSPNLGHSGTLFNVTGVF